MTSLLTEFKTFEKNLVCPSDISRNGKYTIFTYDNVTSHLTAYHEDAKKEYYMPVEEFKRLYSKV